MELESRCDDVFGTSVHSRVGGLGPPIVLVHGYAISGRYFLPLAELLAPDHETYVPDLPAVSGGIGGLARLLGDWMETVGLARPMIVANSLGTQVVTELAARKPEHVGPLVLIGPTVEPQKRNAPRQAFGALRDATREPMSLLGLVAKDGPRFDIRQLMKAARAALADRMEDRLPLIEQRTVVVHGERDGFVSLEWAEEVASLLPRGRLVVAPGAPHAVHFAQPEFVAGVVRDLVAEELEHAGSQVVRRLPHRDVPAGELHEAGVG